MISFAMPVIRQSEGARGDLHGRDLDEVLVVCIPQRELKEEGYGHQEKSYGLRASWQKSIFDVEDTPARGNIKESILNTPDRFLFLFQT